MKSYKIYLILTTTLCTISLFCIVNQRSTIKTLTKDINMLTDENKKMSDTSKELKKSIDGISQKVLTTKLRDMEKSGLLSRTVYPEVPPRVEYTLTELGQSLRPIIKSMQDWGINYQSSHVS